MLGKGIASNVIRTGGIRSVNNFYLCHHPLIHEVIRQAPHINENSKILHVGCGMDSGLTTLEIARLTGASVVGVDKFKYMISNANKLLRSAYYNYKYKVEFAYYRHCNICNGRHDDFDAILVTIPMPSWASYEVYVKRLYQILKPHRPLIVVNIFYKKRPLKHSIYCFKNVTQKDPTTLFWTKKQIMSYFEELKTKFKFLHFHEEKMPSLNRYEAIDHSKDIIHVFNEYLEKNNDYLERLPESEQTPEKIAYRMIDIINTPLLVLNDHNEYLGYFAMSLSKQVLPKFIPEDCPCQECNPIPTPKKKDKKK